ncbi:MAG: hypothetical protein U0797_17695 [Gemmataceae bacterium]
MIVTRLRWLAALGVTLGLSGWLPAQQPVVWRAAGSRPPAPVASLGKPIPLARPVATRVGGAPVVRAQSAESTSPSDAYTRHPSPPTADPVLGDVTPAVAGGPEPGVTIPLPNFDNSPRVSEHGVGVAPPQPALTTHTSTAPPDDVPPPPTAPFPPSGDVVAPGVITDQPVSPSFWDKCVDAVSIGDKGSTHGRHAFGSDSCFPGMISPVTMPFYFEDPRSLTEVRPIISYQSVPGSAGGGNIFFLGTQARVSFTDRLSVVVNELGFLTGDIAGAGATGFAEVKLGPKWTFLRNTETGTVGAVGLTFEIPCGGGNVFQNTGSLSMDPYVSIGQTFGLGGGYGSLNLLGTTGYSFSVDSERAEFYYLNFHIDYNIAGLNKIYPLFELNWIHYTNTPTSRPLTTEGAWLANLGASQRQGDDWLALAPGLRYRISDNVITGFAAEFPVLSMKALADYRLIFDVIFRF